MSGIIQETDRASSTSAQEAAVEDAMERLRISPRKVLVSLSRLRIDKAKIKPIEGQVPKAGGKADVEAAMLVSAPFSSFPESDDMEYVAVKKLRFDEDTDHDRALAPLAHEVNLLNDLSHENVVRIIGFVEEVEQGVAWLVFAWEKNGNLREFIRSANWELPERVSLINDVARGLNYLHGRSPPICHGDLKSLNILVNSENRAVITDFGSARVMGLVEEGAPKDIRAAKATSRSYQTSGAGAQNSEALSAEIAPSGDFITMTGPAWTIRWAAPELLEGCLPGLASDIWALGWICWEAVTGNFPFDKENDTAIVLRIAKGDLPTIENDDQLKQIKALCSLMRECWKLDMDERSTALRCQQVVGWMDQTLPSPREGNGLSATRSSGLSYALGRIQLRNDMYTEAREYFEQSLKAAGSAEDEWGTARALKAIGDTFYLQDEYSKAGESYIQAHDIYSQTGDQLGLAESVKSLGDVYYIWAEYSKAEESYTQAREICAQIGNQLVLSQSVKGLGHVYRMRAEYSKAEESYIQAREIYFQVGDQLGLAQSVQGLGDVYHAWADYSKAEESYTQAREICSQIGDQLGFAQSVMRLGDLYLMRDEYSNAEESYIQAREICSQIGDKLGFAQSVKSLGDVYLMRDEYSNAEESYIQARETYSQIGDQLGLAQSLKGMGRLHLARGEHVKAEESYSISQDICRRIGEMRGLADISWYLGWLRRRQAQYGEAERLIREASTIYDGLGLTQDVKECDEFIEQIQQLM